MFFSENGKTQLKVGSTQEINKPTKIEGNIYLFVYIQRKIHSSRFLENGIK
jgi:hypothetical protein